MPGQDTQDNNMTELHDNRSLHDWNLINSIVLLLGTGLALYFRSINVLTVLALMSFVVLLISQKKVLSQYKPYGGYANWVTIFRMGLILLGIAFHASISSFGLFAILGIALLLDLLDGWLARRFKQESTFGMYLDMETDALFVLLACVYLYFQGFAHIWILIPATLRYFYRIVIFLFPKEKFKEQKQKYAAIIAGSFFVILLLSILIQNNIQQIALVIGSLGIIASFGKSFWDYFTYADTTYQ